MFQHTRAEKEETKQMLRSINKAISEEPVPEPALDMLFEQLWPILHEGIKKMPLPDSNAPEERTVQSMVAEMLDMMRAEQGREEREAREEAWQRLFTQNYNTVMQGVHPRRGFPKLVDNVKWAASFPACPVCGAQGSVKEMYGIKECENCGATNSAIGPVTL